MTVENHGQTPKAEPKSQAVEGEPSKPTEQLIDLGDGQKVTAEKLTKMWVDTQAEIKKLQMGKSKEPQTDEQVEAQTQLEAVADLLIPFLKERGLATSDDVRSLKGDREFEKLIATVPGLESKKQIILDLSKANQGMAYADIVEKYGLKESKKATDTSGDVTGDINRQTAAGGNDEMNIDDVHTPEDMAKYEKQHNVGQSTRRLNAQRSIV